MKKHSKLSKRNYSVLESALTIGLSFLAKELIKKSWEKVTDKPAPENPESDKNDLKEVIVFTMSVALIGAAVKLITRSNLSKRWDKLGGELPKKLQ